MTIITAEKKPVRIQAMVLDGTWERARAVAEWIGPAGFVRDEDDGHGAAVSILTLEGEMLARPGDYVIRGIKGEFYPCKPDVFAASYDLVCPHNHVGTAVDLCSQCQDARRA